MKIKSIKSVGLRPVWDIRVEEDHSYVSLGGYINHNSSDPNVQNIPKEARGILIARPDHSLITADYSQYEFRAAAAITGEQYLIDTFNERYNMLPLMIDIGSSYGVNDPDHLAKAAIAGKIKCTKGEMEQIRIFSNLDIHRRNASLVLHKDIDQIGDSDRSVGKTLGYALLYGSGPGTMLQQLFKSGVTNIKLTDCMTYREIFMSQLGKIAKFIEETHERVIDPGYIETILGRKRWFSLCPKYMTSRYEKELADAQREAVNWKFQASNADATKLGMVQMSDLFISEFEDMYQPHCLLNVHDETVTESHDLVIPKAKEIILNAMLDAGNRSVKYGVPIEVSVEVSKKWAK
jgi:DNA polymerase-1